MVEFHDQRDGNSNLTINDETQNGNVWPNKIPKRIDESHYNFVTLMKVVFQSFSGVIFISLSTFLLVWSALTGVETLASISMCLACFATILLAIFMIKYKITATSNDVSTTLLLRYYDFGTFCMILFLLFANHGVILNKNHKNIYYVAHIVFDISLGLVFILSVILASYPGTIRQQFMMFFCMWPMNQTSKPSKLLHILWISRQLLQVFIMAYTAISSEVIMAKNSRYDTLEISLAQTAFFSAAFVEEYFKFMIAASVPFIAKYNKSKSAILHVCIMVGLSFDLVENMQYVNGYGWIAMFRMFGFAAHFVFAYPLALAITRQRDSLIWWFELLLGFCLGILVHGSFNYMVFLLEADKNKYSYLLIPQKVTYVMFFIVGLTILYRNPFLPKDDLASRPRRHNSTIENRIPQGMLAVRE